jgi:hypothetical protein
LNHEEHEEHEGKARNQYGISRAMQADALAGIAFLRVLRVLRVSVSGLLILTISLSHFA